MSTRFRPFLRDGLRLSVAQGPGSGPVALFQHGLCGDSAQTMEVMPHEDVTAVTLECRGHGRSDAGDPAGYGIARFADDVAALAETLGTPRFVGGISMGAAIAARLAVLRPDLVRALVLARPAWVTEPAPENMVPNAEVGHLLTQPGQTVQAFRNSPTGQRLAAQAPDNLTSLSGFFAREPRDVTSALLTRISADGPGIAGDDLRALNIPCLIVATDEDAIHPLSHAQHLARLIPDARLVTITPKSRDRAAYAAEFRAALQHFTRHLPHAQTA
ncbi:alpha/beta fold hydrolase [Paracoccus sp. (in: a-proteobacteria)]|uniref:alpha/beta fold hydrolase n=1 Tax=Paracoccus sp. TaxID=267 RepID=UPI003A845601